MIIVVLVLTCLVLLVTLDADEPGETSDGAPIVPEKGAGGGS